MVTSNLPTLSVPFRSHCAVNITPGGPIEPPPPLVVFPTLVWPCSSLMLGCCTQPSYCRVLRRRVPVVSVKQQPSSYFQAASIESLLQKVSGFRGSGGDKTRCSHVPNVRQVSAKRPGAAILLIVVSLGALCLRTWKIPAVAGMGALGVFVLVTIESGVSVIQGWGCSVPPFT